MTTELRRQIPPLSFEDPNQTYSQHDAQLDLTPLT